VLLAGAVPVGIAALAQSGRGTMHGYVAFEDVAWNDVASTNTKARIELRGVRKSNSGAYKTETDDHGLYDIKAVRMGEYTLKINSPGYKTYQTDIYIPSDFECKLATMLKKTQSSPSTEPKQESGE